uniref:Uncharacterized protein n=1 Tax=Ciona savignyi TaxID=51511 RepID=H2ZAQ7_CIOSA
MWKSLFGGLVVLLAVYLALFGRKKQYNPDDVKGLRVVVTGGSSGIGEQIAYKFASMGAKLHVSARRESKLIDVTAHAKDVGAQEAHYFVASLSSYINASLLIQDAMQKLGGIDVLILNHFTSPYVGFYRHEAKDIEQLFMTNMLTHAHLASAAMETLKENKGRIAATSSAVAFFGSPYTIPYTTTKCALVGFFQSLDHELTINKTDVSVSLVHLGYIEKDTTYKKTNDKIKHKPASKVECAAEMVRGIMMREREVYFPASVSWVPLFQALFPDYISN